MMKKRASQSGNIFFMLFASVAMAGALAVGSTNVMKGLVTSMSDVTRKTVAEEKMSGASRLVLQSATATQTNSGDCDMDGFVEPLPFADAGSNPKPVGGGWVPEDIGIPVIASSGASTDKTPRDPWGTPYGYCAWDAGAITVSHNNAGCGGSGANRLNGLNNADSPVVAIISAGKDRKFSSTCTAVTPANCSAYGTSFYNDPVSGHCYWKSNATAANFAAAETACRANGGYLASITSAAETALIVSNINNTEYLAFGISDLATEGNWIYTSGELVGQQFWLGGPTGQKINGNYSNWAAGNPDQALPNDDCGGLFYGGSTNGTWSDGGCFSAVKYLCEKSPALPVTQASGSDDVVMTYSYNDAGAVSGDDLWKIKDTAPNTAAIDKSIEVAGSGKFSGTINLMEKGLILPADPGDNSVTGACNGTTDQQLRLNISTSPIRLEICHLNVWVPMAMDGGDEPYACDASWTARDSDRGWTDVAMSADGTKQVATVFNGSIYNSINSGATWTPRDSTRTWMTVDMSSDGNSAIATAMGSNVYTSTDGGNIWVMSATGGMAHTAATISGDGTDRRAADVGQQIYTSINNAAWTTSAAIASWTHIDSSADGTKAAATSDGPGRIYVSTGGAYAARATNQAWKSVAMSDDGITMIASVDGGQLYVSKDTGLTWTAKETSRQWRGVAISADGTKMAAVVNNGKIYTSGDTGDTWQAVESNRQWVSVAMSADGKKVTAAAQGGKLYTAGCSGGAEAPTPDPSLNIPPTQGFMQAPDFLGCTSTGVGPLNKASEITTSVSSQWLWGDGTYLYGTGTSGGLRAYSLASSTPALITTALSGQTVYGVWGDGTYIYVALGATLKTFTFNGTAFTEVGSIAAAGGAKLWGDGQYIYLANGATGVKAFSFDGTTFTLLGTQDTPGTANDVWGDGKYIYVSDATSLQVLSFDGAAFATIANIATTASTESWGDGKYIYVVDNGVIRIFTFNGTALTFVTSFTPSGGATARNIWGDGVNIFAGYSDSVIRALRFNGTVMSQMASFTGADGGKLWGDGNYIYWMPNNKLYTLSGFGCGQAATPPAGLALAVNQYRGKIASGAFHSCGIKPDSSAWCWGFDSNGSLGNGSALGDSNAPSRVDTQTLPNNFVQIDATSQIGCGIKGDGSGWCWGFETTGNLGNGAVLTGHQQNPTPLAAAGTNIWAQLSVANNGGCGIQNDGTGWCWGVDTNGRAANGAGGNTVSPTAMSDVGPWVQISTGIYNGCGIKTDGSAWCWGTATNGALGNGASSGIYSVPQRVSDPGPWIEISVNTDASYPSTCGIKFDGTAWCWGMDYDGKLGNGSTITADQTTPSQVLDPGPWATIAPGVTTTCGLKTDGSAWCWGDDSNGALGNGGTLTADQHVPSRVLNFPDQAPLAWNDAQTILTKPAAATTVSIGTAGKIGFDDVSGGFSYTGSGRSILSTTGSTSGASSQMMIETQSASNDAQTSFKTVTGANTRSIGIDNATGSLEFGLNNAGVTDWMSAITPQMEITPNGYVGVGTTGTANALLDINGGLRIGNDARTCTPSRMGTIKYVGGSNPYQYCDGSAWVNL